MHGLTWLSERDLALAVPFQDDVADLSPQVANTLNSWLQKSVPATPTSQTK